MHNKENSNLNQVTLKHKTSFFNRSCSLEKNQTLQDKEQASEPFEEEHFMDNDLDFLAMGSLRTISRGSLERVPELSDLFVDSILHTEDIVLPKRFSQPSVFQEEDEDSLMQNEQKLISETRQLILSSSEQESSPSSFGSRSAKNKTASPHSLNRPLRIKQLKELLRAIKRRRKLGQYKWAGNFCLKSGSTEINVKEGTLSAILSDKGIIGGLTIEKGSQEILMKLKHPQKKKGQIVIQLWDQQAQRWEEYLLTIEFKQ